MDIVHCVNDVIFTQTGFTINILSFFDDRIVGCINERHGYNLSGHFVIYTASVTIAGLSFITSRLSKNKMLWLNSDYIQARLFKFQTGLEAHNNIIKYIILFDNLSFFK